MKNKFQIFISTLMIIITCAHGRHRHKYRAYEDFSNELSQEVMLASRFGNPEDCQFGICEDVEDYPKDKIMEMLKGSKAVHSYFGNVFEPVADNIISRAGPSYDSLCSSETVVASPRQMLDNSNILRTIVNVPNYRQFVKYQKCKNGDGEKCFTDKLISVNSRCEQKFTYVSLYGFNETTAEGRFYPFSFPTYCVCTYAKDFVF